VHCEFTVRHRASEKEVNVYGCAMSTVDVMGAL
jgi:hypothetical protein